MIPPLHASRMRSVFTGIVGGTLASIALLALAAESVHAQAGAVLAPRKISQTSGGFTGTLRPYHDFGAALASLPDLDSDGVGELAVGAPGDDDGGPNRGAVWVLFPRRDGTVKRSVKVGDATPVLDGALADNDRFGSAVASLGDLDGDGGLELAIGAPGADDGGISRGAVWVVSLSTSGDPIAASKISQTDGGFPGTLTDNDGLGSALSVVADLDDDGTPELAAGVANDDGEAGYDRGAVWILFLSPDGSVHGGTRIAAEDGPLAGQLENFDRFGQSVAALGDLDGDGLEELAVGAPGDDGGDGLTRGAVWLVFLDADGSAKSVARITVMQGGFSGLPGVAEQFGASLARVGDIDQDGVDDLAVGAPHGLQGAVWLLFLNADGSVRTFRRLDGTVEALQRGLDFGDELGRALAPLGDLDGNGAPDLAVGAPLDDDGGLNFGAAWLLMLDPNPAFCAATTLDTCRTGLRSKLSAEGDIDASRSKLGFDWGKGQATSQAEFADPTSSSEYALCLYSSDPGKLVAEIVVPPSSGAWVPLGSSGFSYRDTAGSSGGISKMKLKGAATDSARVLVKGRGEGLPRQLFGNLPTTEGLVMQLVNRESERCWEARFDPEDLRSNEPGRLRASVSD